jgi:hypothetical protein
MNQVLRPLVPQKPNNAHHFVRYLIRTELKKVTIHSIFTAVSGYRLAQDFGGMPAGVNSRLDGSIKEDTPLDR